MLLRQDVRLCFAEAVGGGGLDRVAFETHLGHTSRALDRLRRARRDRTLPLLALPTARDDLVRPAAVAERFRRGFEHVALLGTGGSSLGARTLSALADRGFGPEPGRPRLHFLDNVDPSTFAAFHRAVDLRRTGFLVVSKSGGTAETLMQTLTILPKVEAAVGRDRTSRHFAVVTEPRDNPLRRLAASRGIETLEHDPGLGGRYSVLSLVGLLPAMMAGLDPFAVRQGAVEVLDAALAAAQPDKSPPAVGAALGHGLARERGQTQAVLMPYADALAPFGSWFRQLWAESLGKGGLGTTPITALGAVDQHSQLQLYLDGPADKFYTLILLDRAGTGERVDPGIAAGDRDLGYLVGRTMGDLIAAEQEATVETLARHARPVRVLRLSRLDEHAMGALFMHFMLETIIAADLAGVDPFDQPAVEEGKRLARDRLAGMATKT